MAPLREVRSLAEAFASGWRLPPSRGFGQRSAASAGYVGNGPRLWRPSRCHGAVELFCAFAPSQRLGHVGSEDAKMCPSARRSKARRLTWARILQSAQQMKTPALARLVEATATNCLRTPKDKRIFFLTKGNTGTIIIYSFGDLKQIVDRGGLGDWLLPYETVGPWISRPCGQAETPRSNKPDSDGVKESSLRSVAKRHLLLFNQLYTPKPGRHEGRTCNVRPAA